MSLGISLDVRPQSCHCWGAGLPCLGMFGARVKGNLHLTNKLFLLSVNTQLLDRLSCCTPVCAPVL